MRSSFTRLLQGPEKKPLRTKKKPWRQNKKNQGWKKQPSRTKKNRGRKKKSRTRNAPSLWTWSQGTFIFLFHPKFILSFWVLPITIFPRIDADLLWSWLRWAFAIHCFRWSSTPLAPPPQTSFSMAPASSCVPQSTESPQRLGDFLFQCFISSGLPSNFSKACRQYWIVSARLIITTLSSLALSFVVSVGDRKLGGGLCVCVGGRTVGVGCTKNHTQINEREKPADLENEGRFILMLQPLGLVVSWANRNKPSCWHVIASLYQGYVVGHVRVEPAAEGRRALQVQCSERHLRTDWHARFEDFDRDDAKSATYYSEKIPVDNCLPAFETTVDKAKGGSSQILNMRAQYPLHSVVAIWRTTYTSDRGIFSYLPDFIHMIFQKMLRRDRKASL